MNAYEMMARLGAEVVALEQDRAELRRTEKRAERLRQRLEEARREASYLGELAGLVEVELVVGEEPEGARRG